MDVVEFVAREQARNYQRLVNDTADEIGNAQIQDKNVHGFKSAMMSDHRHYYTEIKCCPEENQDSVYY